MSEKLSVEARAVMDLTSRENATYIDVLDAVQRMEAAAEERGRRRGVEEAAKFVREECKTPSGRIRPEEVADEILEALAPRDSGKEG